jgi:DNA-binding NarL/FixJ family response regulator
MPDLAERRVRVAHVEDHLWAAEAWARVLAEYGFETVVIATSVAEAERVLADVTFDVALVDLELGPREGGGERVLAWLRRNKPGVYSVVITGHSEVGDAVLQRALAQHPHGWLSKKVSAEEAVHALSEIMGNGLHGWYASPDLRPAVGNRRPFSAYENMTSEVQRFFLEFAVDGDQQKVFCERYHYSPATFHRRISQIKELILRELVELDDSVPRYGQLTNEFVLRWARDRYYHYR